MKNKNAQIVRAMEESELIKHIEDARRSLFSLRLSAAGSHVEDFSQFKKLRRAIARGLTILSEKQVNGKRVQ